MRFDDDELQALWERTEVLDAPETSPALRRNFDWMMRGAKAARKGERHPLRRVAAVAALLIAGITAGLLWPRAQTGYGEPIRVIGALTEPGTPAAARLAAVDLLGGDPLRHQATLLRLAATDPNVNVRLAVLDRLGRLAADGTVVASLPSMLDREGDPLPRMALIDLIVAGDVRPAVPILERIAHDEAQDPLVIAKAEWALRALQPRRPLS